jgi:hypothetical protein
VGSSKSMILGCMVRALAMATRCFWPPESRMGCSSLLSAPPVLHRHTSRRNAYPTMPFPRAIIAKPAQTVQNFPNSFLLLESRIATLEALRPGIPMTPPPGCVPEPHR